MPVTNYYTANGQIIAEATAGVRTDYLMDALGSVTATVNQSGAIVNTYRHKPYGGLLAKTGVGSDPSFLWVGSQGYRQTGKKYSEVYIRARHYDTNRGRWNTKDPLDLERDNKAYVYAELNPTFQYDPSGLDPDYGCIMRYFKYYVENGVDAETAMRLAERMCDSTPPNCKIKVPGHPCDTNMGPCRPDEVSGCRLICIQVQQTSYEGCYHGINTVCCACYLPCRLHSSMNYQQAVDQIHIWAKADGYKLVGPLKPEKATTCGITQEGKFVSDPGDHYTWKCYQNGSWRTGWVSTVQCCGCKDSPQEIHGKMRCKPSRCHKR